MTDDSRVLDDLAVLFLREIDALGREVALYPDDEAAWRAIPGLPNTGGTLVLHLAGNLRHFIGATLGRTGYARDRDAEFATRGVARHELHALVETARAEVASTLRELSPSVLDAPYPLPLAGHTLPTGLFLSHLLSHLAFHLGQLDYHRRASTGDAQSARPISLAALGDEDEVEK